MAKRHEVPAVPATAEEAPGVVKHARIELPETDYDRLKKAAKRYHLSVAGYIRLAVIERIESDEVPAGAQAAR